MPDENYIDIEVAYALPGEQLLLPVKLPADSTVWQAIEASGILNRYPAMDGANAKLGIFGRLVSSNTVLRDGDRVEIYRPLIADPKLARRQRAGQASGKKQGL